MVIWERVIPRVQGHQHGRSEQCVRHCAGKLRAVLDAFLADLAAWAGGMGGPGAPCLQGFAAVAQHMLREQTSAVQVCLSRPFLPTRPRTLQSRSIDEVDVPGCSM